MDAAHDRIPVTIDGASVPLSLQLDDRHEELGRLFEYELEPAHVGGYSTFSSPARKPLTVCATKNLACASSTDVTRLSRVGTSDRYLTPARDAVAKCGC